MNQKLMLILIAAVDIWAALFITQIQRPRHWEVSLAISEHAKQESSLNHVPVQIWMKKDESMGLWPPNSKSQSIEMICEYLSGQNETTKEVRLVCDPSLDFEQWGPIAVRLSKLTPQIRLAPLKTPTN